MTQNHTPGPWNIPMWRGKPQRMDGKWLVNAAVRPERGEKVGPPVADIHLSEADARLIAAAPELLAALECSAATLAALRPHVHGNQYGMLDVQVRACLAALAKARPVG